jgi:hypothetical protein
MFATLKFFITLLPIYICSLSINAACVLEYNAQSSSTDLHDALALVFKIAPTCPTDVLELRHFFTSHGLHISSTMVANEGFHHPDNGSFSFFEFFIGQIKFDDQIIHIELGDLSIGHFTALDEQHTIILDQSLAPNKLLIEAIAWDEIKGAYNFYELRADNNATRWYYRGDSYDIYLDNQFLHRQTQSFGTRLRCSGCHSLGGLIIKEFKSPHNDWWQKNRPLLFGNYSMDSSVTDIINELHSAKLIAKAVNHGNQKLLSHPKFNAHLHALSWQERLRPLFCPVELNLKSDNKPFLEKHAQIEIPVDFFVDHRLLPKDAPSSLTISHLVYDKLLQQHNSHFPETTLPDGDHAWLTPVKAAFDEKMIDQLIKDGMIDEKFVYDVLMIDFTNPVFSQARCGLLHYLPDTATDNWRNIFITQLQTAAEPEAQELLSHMTNAGHDPKYHRKKVSRYLSHCKREIKKGDQISHYYRLLLQRRSEIRASEISKNPLGQILEPGFRVIFPTTDSIPLPYSLALDEKCRA